MTEWFIQGEEEEEDEGPIRPPELLAMVRRGEVARDTMIRKDDSQWVAAGAVGGLFEAAMRPTIEFFCPQCDQEVDEPPTMCIHCGREVHKGITRITENSIVDPDSRSFAEKTSRSMKKWLQKKRIAKDEDGEI